MYKEVWICDECGEEINELDGKPLYRIVLQKMEIWNEFKESWIVDSDKEYCKDCLKQRLEKILEVLENDESIIDVFGDR